MAEIDLDGELKKKLDYTKMLIHCWVEAWGGSDKVYVAFSGGKDSTVLLHIVRELYPEVKGVFSNTGLEFPEIVQFVRTFDNIDIIRPNKPFHKVIKEHGYPIISKTVARYVEDLQAGAKKRPHTVHLRLTGYNQAGKFCPSMKLPKKWLFLKDAPFKISGNCCKYLKKLPLGRWQRKAGLMPMIGIMRSESMNRDRMIATYGCNMYELKEPKSYPLANWTSEDVWAYIKEFGLRYCEVYDNPEIQQTGCTFCMFGIEYDKNKFLRLRRTHPQLHKYCINELGLGKVLDFLEIPY